jgi:uncharacterized protein YndB with AHSA1/START domain
MNTFEVSTFINRSPQEVFDFMTNPANATKWQDGTISGKWGSDGPVGVGSILHTVGKFLGRTLEMEAVVTQWNPPSVWGQKGSSGSMKFENTNKYEPKDGGTLLVQIFQGETGGLFKLAEGLAVKQMQKRIESDGQALKKLLEAM